MTKPSNFILNTDYATLKNDGEGTISYTLPASVIIPAAGIQTYTSDVSIGVPGASVRARISSTLNNVWYAHSTVIYQHSTGGTVLGVGVGYDMAVIVHKYSNTLVRLSISINNPYSDPFTVSLASRTITAHVATFLPPF
jgi:hypothetical protein